MTKVTIKNAPKTLRASLKRAVTFLERNQSSNAMYEDERGCPCLIGSFFTIEQRKWLKEKRLNRKTIDTVEKKIGTKNLLAMTGMNMHQCFVLQDRFDMGFGDSLLTNIKAALVGQNVSIDDVEFKL